MTIWSGALRLAGTTTSRPVLATRHTWATFSISSPSTAAMVPGRRWPACHISSPRRRTRRAASARLKEPAAA
jgi:hypothetical protein